uniref:Solute carrier family 39 (Zinc transporter), member 9 (SLC39A9, ZIP9) n=1 Tax=uncultured marine group II/III euryarchaeote KM3_87_G01 TaxID=1456533 RepID=A0A075HVQ2_9EURY|nr:solute carrier family 39 (zinc transporter), member 9 (SLC39A9, ZIP9) [uncultured marine group II/III euryarchaeote KM3_87_G01]
MIGSDALLLAGVTLAIGLGAGLLPLWTKVSENERVLKWMTGLAAGVLLASALLVALPEGFEIAMDNGIDELLVGGAVLAGFLTMLLLECFGFGHDIHEEHHDHEEDHGHDHVHHPNNANSIVIGLSIHALTDGLAIGAAILTESLVLTISIFLAVLVHKVPAAFSVGLFSMHERSERSDSIRDVVMFSIATPIMILLTFYLLGDVSGLMLGLAILFSGGTFLYVATVDVLPEVHHSATGKTALIQVITGALIMVAILWVLHTTGMAAHSH